MIASRFELVIFDCDGVLVDSEPISAFDLPPADVPMHVLGEPANERFVCLNLAAHLQECASLHCKPDSVIHKPSGLLGDAERAVHLVAA
ncbi:MAG: hypothetical protein JOZ84_15275, partial [Methylobacteriaceae bacterium]|nr:hypothetical protein [Methylobacteriaceae bacterium]